MNYIDEMLDLEVKLGKYGLKWAEYDAESRRLDNLTKTVLAELMLEHIGEPVNMRETRARADKVFKDHLEGLAAAKHEANKYRVMYDTIQAKIEIRRSANALSRAEMGMR